MITFNNIGTYGRFGNQLFQFASVIGISEKLGYDVKFPKRNLSPMGHGTTRENKSFVTYFEINECFDVDQNFFSDDITIEHNIGESSFHFDENLFKIPDNTNILGYLQSEKYFKHCEDKIKNILKFRNDIIEKSNSYLPKTKKELVSIHVRRGDNAIINPYHPCVGLEFINPAIQMFDEKNHHFVVCSDDYNWCKDIWGDNENFTIVNSNSPYIDLCTLSLCNHHIISNSTFSWWSSYLSKNKDKKIVAPLNWFGPAYSSLKTDDLYTENMIKI